MLIRLLISLGLALGLTNAASNVTVQVLGAISACRDAAAGMDGVYLLHPILSSTAPFPAYCENSVQGGGWTVIHRRFDDSLSFNRTWADFKNGFGDLQGQLWLGLEKLHQITRFFDHELLVLTTYKDGSSRSARFNGFAVESELNLYQLRIGDLVAGNFYSDFAKHNGWTFSAFDKGKVGKGCAELLGAGWWYGHFCYYQNWNLGFAAPYAMKEKEARMLIRRL
ncbi:fibrinogen-like protein 1 [Sabethes cyaneus]|uniref:fibrinogen-like protein 1 n=1 Tax=Sabethes cyaneus TaxID=53552 RepID=UPI00237D9C86|nr:fibrinogen-like protein 1 [Sabethes cyaneus]